MTALSDGLTVGVDLGGTKIAVGVVDAKGDIISQVRVPTPADPDLILDAIADAVHEVRRGCGDVQAIGIGAAGYVGRFGMAGEIGHYRAVPDGVPCRCGQSGCIEQYASGSAHVRRAREQAAADPGRAAVLLALGDGTPAGIKGSHVTEAALAGDPFAMDLFEQTGHWVGQALADLASILDPAVFVIGGGLSETGELIRRPAEEAYRRALGGGAHRVHAEVVTATVGRDVGLIGAADLARSGRPEHSHPAIKKETCRG